MLKKRKGKIRKREKKKRKEAERWVGVWRPATMARWEWTLLNR